LWSRPNFFGYAVRFIGLPSPLTCTVPSQLSAWRFFGSTCAPVSDPESSSVDFADGGEGDGGMNSGGEGDGGVKRGNILIGGGGDAFTAIGGLPPTGRGDGGGGGGDISL